MEHLLYISSKHSAFNEGRVVPILQSGKLRLPIFVLWLAKRQSQDSNPDVTPMRE